MTTATEAPIKIIDADTADTKSFRKRPSDYFASNFYFCFWFEQGQDMLDAVRSVGVDNCLFETDFPHPTSLYPFDNLEGRLEGFNYEDRAKLLSLNSSKLYKIPV